MLELTLTVRMMRDVRRAALVVLVLCLDVGSMKPISTLASRSVRLRYMLRSCMMCVSQ